VTKIVLDFGDTRAYRSEFALGWRSSGVEQLICNQPVGGSNPFASSGLIASPLRAIGLHVPSGAFGKFIRDWGRCPSGQREQTVNLPAYAYGGSNPPLPIGGAERLGQKLSQGSAGGFNPARPAGKGGNSSVGRASAFQAEGRGFESRFPLQPMGFGSLAHVAQAAEHFLGKEEVTGSIPVVSSGSSLRGVVGLSAV
jgi:hypothetical protein